MDEFSKALRKETRRRTPRWRDDLPEGEGYAVYGQEGDQEANEAAELLQKLTTKKIRRKLKPQLKTTDEEENEQPAK